MEHHTEHTSKKRAKRRTTDSVDSFLPLFLNSAIGAGLSLLLILLLVPLGGAICFTADDPVAPTTVTGLVIRFLSAMVGGAVAVRKNRGKILLSGGMCGLLLFLLFAVLSLIFPPETRPFSLGVSRLLRIAMIPMSMIGAIIGVKKRQTIKHKSH